MRERDGRDGADGLIGCAEMLGHGLQPGGQALQKGDVDLPVVEDRRVAGSSESRLAGGDVAQGVPHDVAHPRGRLCLFRSRVQPAVHRNHRSVEERNGPSDLETEPGIGGVPGPVDLLGHRGEPVIRRQLAQRQLPPHRGQL